MLLHLHNRDGIGRGRNGGYHKKDENMKRFAMTIFAIAALSGGAAIAQPLPVTTAPPPAAPKEASIKFTSDEADAMKQIINVCIAANPQGCAEAGVLMRKRFEDAFKAPSAPTAAAVQPPPVAPVPPPAPHAGAGAEPPKK